MLEIPLHDKRKIAVERFQLLQDLVGVIQLAPAAQARFQLHTPLTLTLGTLEFAAIAFAVIVGIRELKSRPSHHEEEKAVDYTNLAIAAALLAEWGFKLADGHKWFSPLLLTALTGFFLAFFRPWVQTMFGRKKRRRRILRFDDEGIHARLSKWRSFDVRWEHVRAVELHPLHVRIVLHDGSVHVLKLRRYMNADEIRNAVMTEVKPHLLKA